MLQILLQVSLARAAARQLIRGIGDYGRRHEPWQIEFDERPWLETLKARELTRFDGVIVEGSSPDLVEYVLASGIPAVAVAAPAAVAGLPTVVSDHEAVGFMAAEHLADCGLTHFGCVELNSNPFSSPRLRAFVSEVESRGGTCSVYEQPDRGDPDLTDLANWLKNQPLPIGILAAQDRTALVVIRAAIRCGFQVPEQVAVLGINNEELITDLSWPTISSLDHGAQRIGRDAAELLDQRIRGEPVPAMIVVPPVRVVERHSTDLLAVDDPNLAQALALIRERAPMGLTTSAVLDAVAVSRSTLESRFKAVLGRTIFAEITRVRIQHVKMLLRTTDLGLADIAARTGFRYLSHLSKAFRQATGETPTQFRKR